MVLILQFTKNPVPVESLRLVATVSAAFSAWDEDIALQFTAHILVDRLAIVPLVHKKCLDAHAHEVFHMFPNEGDIVFLIS